MTTSDAKSALSLMLFPSLTSCSCAVILVSSSIVRLCCFREQEETVDTLSVLIFATIAPILTPVLKNFKDVVYNGSAAVIDNNSQTEVFDDDNASDRMLPFLKQVSLANTMTSYSLVSRVRYTDHLVSIFD